MKRFAEPRLVNLTLQGPRYLGKNLLAFNAAYDMGHQHSHAISTGDFQIQPTSHKQARAASATPFCRGGQSEPGRSDGSHGLDSSLLGGKEMKGPVTGLFVLVSQKCLAVGICLDTVTSKTLSCVAGVFQSSV